MRIRPNLPDAVAARVILNSMPTQNPFQDPLRFERRVPECAVVIFGANGDLTKRKLLPALYRLAYDRRLSAGFAVVGISRTPLTDDQFREKMLEAVEAVLRRHQVRRGRLEGLRRGPVLRGRRHRRRRRFISGSAKSWRRSKQTRHTGGNVLFYLSTQPSQYAPSGPGHRRGRASARAAAGGAWWWKSPSATTWPARAS